MEVRINIKYKITRSNVYGYIQMFDFSAEFKLYSTIYGIFLQKFNT